MNVSTIVLRDLARVGEHFLSAFVAQHAAAIDAYAHDSRISVAEVNGIPMPLLELLRHEADPQAAQVFCRSTGLLWRREEDGEYWHLVAVCISVPHVVGAGFVIRLRCATAREEKGQ
jgi:hypothetical protein